MKRATVYRRDVAFLIHPSSRTTEGVWILSEPCVRLSTDCSDAELGSALLSALENSKPSLPHPTQWSGILEPLLKAARVKSWKMFVKGAVCVEVEDDAGVLEAIPTVNLGADDGFQTDERAKKSITIPSSPDAIGAVVREAVASAR